MKQNLCYSIGLFVILLGFTFNSSVYAQSRCDTACANDMSCKTGLCILTKCSDDGGDVGCFEYCLNCAGIETCYAMGETCNYTGNVVRLGSTSSSNELQSSSKMLYIYFLLFLLFFLF